MFMGIHRRKGPLSELWKTLLRPDHDEKEMADRLVLIAAANQLQVGEFQFMQLAYWEWFAEDLPEARISKLFTGYMLKSEVPYWARHYARQIIEGCENGTIDENALHFHRYDHDYGQPMRHGVRKFSIAVACLTVFIGGGILLATLTVKNPASMFPPYIELDDMPKPKGMLKEPGSGWNAPHNTPQHTPAWPGSEEYFV
ncbi:MAG: hypothetical protein IIC56_01260 [Proteobacteria bacterium]|nr:hypothetical protein [Pseudomonadota bacterium]